MITATALFGIFISVVCFGLAILIQKKLKIVLASPLIVSVAFIVIILLAFNIPLEHYQIGGDFISVFIAPATAALSINIYNQRALLRKNLLPVLGGTASGSLAAILSAQLLSELFGLDEKLKLSLLMKSTTTAIAAPLSEAYDGVVSITILAVMIAGLVGALFGPLVFKLTKANSIAAGLGMGTASHAMGTTKAVELGEVQGAMSGLAIGLAGLFTVVWMAILF